MGVTFVTEMNDYYIYNHKRPDIISQNMNDLKTKNIITGQKLKPKEITVKELDN